MGVSGVPSSAKSVALEPAAIEAGDREFLLELARTALSVAVESASPSLLSDAMNGVRLLPLWRRRGACFVTMFEADELRGCMGVVDPSTRLSEAVVEATIASALDDPRFWPIGPSELGSIQLDISVLGPLTPVDDPHLVRLGVDGVAIDVNGHRALLLPEVATEHGLDGQELWRTLCRKAALPADAWLRSDAHLLLFRTIRFGGPACYSPEGCGLNSSDAELMQ